MKRWLMVLAVVVAVAVVSTLALVPSWDALFTRPGVTPENFTRLHAGMSRGEVEAILGRPGTDGSNASTNIAWAFWEADGFVIGIQFCGGIATRGDLVTDDDQVMGLSSRWRPSCSPLLRWLGLPNR